MYVSKCTCMASVIWFVVQPAASRCSISPRYGSKRLRRRLYIFLAIPVPPHHLVYDLRFMPLCDVIPNRFFRKRDLIGPLLDPVCDPVIVLQSFQ
nr:MAG TPA: hypothetical protein [Caudoviricetes sp.]